MKRKVMILHTGGTLGMVKTPNGLEPAKGVLYSQLQHLEALKSDDMPEFTHKDYEPLIDSSQASIDDWNHIANDIHQHYNEYDGFVIFHGTDTLAYTATALSFMLQNLNKPIVVTGAQKSILEKDSDAKDNIIHAIKVAANSNINEVCILFYGKVFRANRTTKISTYDFDAFMSPNYPLLGEINNGDIIIHKENILPTAESESLRYIPMKSTQIRNIKITPLTTATDIYNQFTNIKAGIVETYGSGNMPIGREFLEVFDQLHAANTILINQTQCLTGGVTSDYSIGATLKKHHLTPCLDMTFETSFCKLLHLFSLDLEHEKILELYHQNLLGELTSRRNDRAEQ